MKCTSTSRCINSQLIDFDNIIICKNCSSIFEKNKKKLNKQILFKCCNKQIINNTYNKPICDNCKRICVINI